MSAVASLRKFLLVASALLCAPSFAVPIPGQGTWETTLLSRDLDADGHADAYYDTTLDITWFGSLGPTLSYRDSLPWVDSFEFGGYADWRLPTRLASNVNQSEVSSLFRNTLGNTQRNFGNVPSSLPRSWHNTGYFEGLTVDTLIAIEQPVRPGNPAPYLYFSGNEGHDTGMYGSPKPIWAVRDGDSGVAPVPEPSTWALLLTGLLAVTSLTRKKRSTTL